MIASEATVTVEPMVAVEVTTRMPPRKPVTWHGIAGCRGGQDDCDRDEDDGCQPLHDALTSFSGVGPASIPLAVDLRDRART